MVRNGFLVVARLSESGHTALLNGVLASMGQRGTATEEQLAKDLGISVSAIAVVALVVFTVAAQHSSRGAYVFGILALLTAAGLFGAYIKALPKGSSTNQATENAEAAQQSKTADQTETLVRNVRADLGRRLLLFEEERALQAHEELYALYKQRAKEREHQFRAFCKGASVHRASEIRVGSYYTEIQFQHYSVPDPASIIANIVEKLCASTKEPRFEFVLEPDGRFKIQQISAKRASEMEPKNPSEEQAGPPAESEKPQLVN